MRRAPALAALAALTLAAGCGGTPSPPAPQVPGGVPSRGADAIREHGCGSCHAIPGIRGADATVGPPLTRFGRRAFIAGRLPNTPENLILWISDPRQVDPRTAMPDVGVSDEEARDIAAYLLELR